MRLNPSSPPKVETRQSPGWSELWLKEDWLAVWIGLGLVIASYWLFLSGSSLEWIAVAPKKWATFDQLTLDLLAKIARYATLGVTFLILFSTAGFALG